MNNSEVIEGNKLIAQYACIKNANGTINSNTKRGFPKGTMHFNLYRCPINTLYPEGNAYAYYNMGRWECDWSWLMPVVEKIKSTAGPLSSRDDIEKQIAFQLFTLGITTPIETVYAAVVNYIKWYNKNK